MGKITTKIINDFSKGMTSETRSSDFRYSQLIKNFDAHLHRKKLVPLRSSVSGDSAPTTSQKQNFQIAIRSGSTYNLFALGVKTGTAIAEVLMKTLGTGGTNDMGDNGWLTPTNNQSGSGSTDFNLFIYYKHTTVANSRIYGAKGGDKIWSFDPTSTASWNDSERSLTYTNIAQGLVHSKDDILYIPYDNKIAKNNQGSWTDEALVVPEHFKITSICEYGNYLAIGCSPLSGVGKSVVYLWDRDATLTTLSESIDWGESVLQVLEEIEGRLIGISYTAGFKARLIFREYSSGEANVFQQIEADGTASSDILKIAKQKINNYLYFMATMTIDGTEHQGVWKIGRQGLGRPFSVVMDSTANNDTATQTLKNFFKYNDYTFISYTASSVYALSKTNDQATYNHTSYYETSKILGDSSQQTKKLLGACVLFEALPSGAKVSLKYKKDEETAWTTIYADFTTANAIRHSAINIESSGATLPKFKELKFQITSYANAVITGIIYMYEDIDDDIVKFISTKK